MYAAYSRLTGLVLLCAALSNAQIASRISGSVVDPSGAAVPNAAVGLLLPDGARALYTAVTSGEGLFTLVGVPSGTYTVSVTANGFRKYAQRGVELTPGIETSLPAVKLELGSTTEVVEIKGDAVSVQSTNAEISVSLSRNQVADLPSLNRSPQVFITTQAGVSNGRNGASVFNGQRTSFTNVTLDGINIQDNYIRTNGADYSPNLLLLDQVAEMTISTSNASPAAGGGASQVIFVTPSGTNLYHGSVFWSNRNNALAANTWFNNRDRVAKPFLNQNQTGATFGGPIRRDKLFFYTNFEAYRLRQQSAQNRTILTADAQQGIFTYLDSSGNPQKRNILTATGNTADPTTAAIIKLLPAPSQINNTRLGDSTASLVRNTGGYSFNQGNNRDRNNLTAKLDYNISPKHTLSGTFLYNTDLLDRPDVTATSFALVPLVSNDDKVYAGNAGWRWNPRSSLTNEVRAGFNRAPALFLSNQTFPAQILNSALFSNPVNTFRSQGRDTNTYNFNDNAAWMRGKHNVQFGFQMQRIFAAPFADSGITPTYTLAMGTGNSGLTNAQLPGASSTDIQAANDLLAALAGYVTSYTQTYNALTRTSGFVPGATNLRHWTTTNYSGYVTDAWKVMPRLTLNLGVRYEFYTPVTEQNGMALLPQLAGGNALDALLSNSTLDFAGRGTGRPLYGSDYNNFGPNIGLAWDPTGSGRTAIRAGYSINFVNDENIAAMASSIGNNAGLAQIVTGSGLTARVAALPPIATPAFQVPRTFQDNFRVNSQAAFGIPDPNLRTPYVQQWNIGVQHDIRGFVVDLRYVGNHGTKLYRGIDFNQINFDANGFLGDFKRAQSNGNLARAAGGAFDPAYNSNLAGSQQLTVFPLLAAGGNLANAANRTLIDQGQVAELARTYQIAGNNGSVNFFPNRLAQTLWMLTNYSNSTYNALQVDVRTREHRGLTFQANYTFSKVLTDATSGSDNTLLSRNEPFLDNRNPKIERSRATFDLTHSMKANFVYRLPLGEGHRFRVKGLNRVLSGWQVSGVFNSQSGVPFSVYSQYGTFTRAGQALNNTVNTSLNKDQLDQIMELRFASTGPYFINASAIGKDGRGIAASGSAPFSGQAFSTPAAGTLGTLQRRLFSGPWNTGFDLGASKVVRITERQSITLRMDSTNIFNHPTFTVGDQIVTSTTFGQVTSTLFARRVFQFTLQYRF